MPLKMFAPVVSILAQLPTAHKAAYTVPNININSNIPANAADIPASFEFISTKSLITVPSINTNADIANKNLDKPVIALISNLNEFNTSANPVIKAMVMPNAASPICVFSQGVYANTNTAPTSISIAVAIVIK